MKYKKLISTSIFIVLILALNSCAHELIGDEGALDEDIYLNYQTITDLELPFTGEWHVEVGGRTHRNGLHHFISRGAGERYAYDILIEIDGKIRSGDGSKNEDHYCFGKPLYAPASGKIIEIETNVNDNFPGAINRDQPGGNYIIIDHLNGESSVLAHLKKGSILVSLGDTVAKGQVIAKVGNSGASSAPHLHFQLQGNSGYLNNLGLPAQFLNYYEDSIFIKRGEPTRSQKVRKQ